MIVSAYDTKYSYKYVPTLRLFSEDNSRIRVVVGPVGSGKSVGMVIEIVKRAMEQAPGPDGVRRIKAAVVRNTYPELKKTTIPTFKEWVKEGIHGDYKVADKIFLINRLQAPDGSPVEAEVHFIALDDFKDVRHLLSLEATMVWFNELREIAKSIFDMTDARIGRYPPMKDGGPTWFGIIGDTNPPDEDHWLYKMLETESRLYPADHEKAGQIRLAKFRQASGLNVHPEGRFGIPVPGVHAENLPNLVPGYYQDLAIGKDQDWIKVFIRAEYGYVKDGKPVYGNWNTPTHVSPGPIEVIKNYPLILAWDFGYDFVACLMGQQLANGRVNIKHEFIREGMGARRFAREVIKPFLFANYLGMEIIGTGDLYGNTKMPSDETTCFQELIEAGLPAEPAETNAWQPRFSSVDSLLTKQVSVGGNMVPAFHVDPECKMLIRGFEGEYKYKRILDIRHERYQDKPFKNEYSHLHDSLQYFCMFLEGGLKRYRRRQIASPTQKPLPAGAWT
jgi:hypothetical protein